MVSPLNKHIVSSGTLKTVPEADESKMVSTAQQLTPDALTTSMRPSGTELAAMARRADNARTPASFPHHPKSVESTFEKSLADLAKRLSDAIRPTVPIVPNDLASRCPSLTAIFSGLINERVAAELRASAEGSYTWSRGAQIREHLEYVHARGYEIGLFLVGNNPRITIGKEPTRPNITVFISANLTKESPERVLLAQLVTLRSAVDRNVDDIQLRREMRDSWQAVHNETSSSQTIPSGTAPSSESPADSAAPFIRTTSEAKLDKPSNDAPVVEVFACLVSDESLNDIKERIGAYPWVRGLQIKEYLKTLHARDYKITFGQKGPNFAVRVGKELNEHSIEVPLRVFNRAGEEYTNPNANRFLLGQLSTLCSALERNADDLQIRRELADNWYAIQEEILSENGGL